jgi:hypothetical protein
MGGRVSSAVWPSFCGQRGWDQDAKAQRQRPRARAVEDTRQLGRRGNGADINAKETDGETPLLLITSEASNAYKAADVEFLLTHGAEVNAKDNNGNTPLHEAALHGLTDIAELLRQHGGHE